MPVNRSRPRTRTIQCKGRVLSALLTLRAMSIWTFPLGGHPYLSALSVTAAIIGRKSASCKESAYMHYQITDRLIALTSSSRTAMDKLLPKAGPHQS